MKIQWKKLIICIIIPLAVGGASAFLTKDGIQVFEWINKPPLSPSGMAVSCGVDYSLCPHGYSFVPRACKRKQPGPGLQFTEYSCFSTLSGLSSSLTWKLICWHLYGCQRCGSSSSSQPFSSKKYRKRPLCL